MMVDLEDMVNSYIENGCGVAVCDDVGRMVVEDNYIDSDEEEEANDIKETEDLMKKLFSFVNEDETNKNATFQVEKAWRHVVKDTSLLCTSEFKSKLMIQLRDQGLDAGLCKSEWKTNGKVQAGYYEYIDVNIKGNRYIIELSAAEEFKTAKPTYEYESLLSVFPPIVVCKVKEFKAIARFMCDAMRKSINKQKMYVGSWRTYGYVKAKWFGSYERITYELSTKRVADSNVGSKGVADLLSFPVQSCYPIRRKAFNGIGLLSFDNSFS